MHNSWESKSVGGNKWIYYQPRTGVNYLGWDEMEFWSVRGGRRREEAEQQLIAYIQK